MRITRLALVPLLLAAVLGLGAPAATATTAAPGVGAAAPAPTAYSLLQMNLCLSGLAGCFGRTQYPGVVDEAVATIEATRPDAVTLNEACSGDVERIAAETGMQHRFAAVVYRGAPLPCVRPEGRGVFGNAVLTRAEITSATDRAFAAQSGVEERRWLCASTTEDVRVCATHLSTAGNPEAAAANQAQCEELATVLAGGAVGEATVFAGDVNRRASCAPEGFWTVRDDAAMQQRGIQHAYGSADRLLLPQETVVPLARTDHDALLVRAVRPAQGTGTPVADLRAVVTGPAAAAAGSSATYALTVTNTGPGTATQVVAALGASGLTGGRGSTGARTGTVDVAGTPVRGSSWTVPSLAPGASVTFTLTGRVPARAGAEVRAVGGAQGASVEGSLGDNAAGTTTSVTG